VNNYCGQKYDHLLNIRAIACLVVLLNHMGWPGFYPRFLHPYGFQAVWLFFLISGYLLSKAFFNQKFTLTKKGILAFYINRLKRLLPLIIFCQVAIVILNHILGGPPPIRLANISNELYILTLGPWVHYFDYGATGYGAISSINSPVWAVLIELDFILVLPLLMWLANKSIHVISFLFAAWLAWLVYLNVDAFFISNHISLKLYPMAYQSDHYNCGFFFAGILIAYFKPKIISFFQPWHIPLASLCCFVGYGIVNIIPRFSSIDHGLMCGPFILIPCFAFLLFSVNTYFHQKLPNRWKDLIPELSLQSAGQKIGAMSFSIYLVHRYFVALFMNISEKNGFTGSPVGWIISVFVITIMILLIASCCYILIECLFREKHKMTLA
jgi:peptidoglycan/LPS O-acetylase OafA/YrhL